MATENPKTIVSFKKGDRGESAFQIAVRKGFTGNESNWLDSLKGKDGYTPVKGRDYNDGVTPVKNVDYFDGKEIELRVINGFIQWRYVVTGVWRNLLALTLIKGDPGKTPVKGVDYFDGSDAEITKSLIESLLTGIITSHSHPVGLTIEIVKEDSDIGSAINLKHAAGSDDQDLTGLQPKEAGKGLSTNDFTTLEKNKLSSIADNANNYSHPANHAPSIITQDTSNRFVTDNEKSNWNEKADGNHNHLGTYEPANENIQAHVLSAHAPSTAQKNSDIHKSEIEAVLTGNIASHTHNDAIVYSLIL